MASIFGDNYDLSMLPNQAGSIMNDHSCILLEDLDSAKLLETTQSYVMNYSLTNVAFVALGDRLFGIANRGVEEGEELFHCYTSRYWLGHVMNDFLQRCATDIVSSKRDSSIQNPNLDDEQKERE